jgi:two-component system chemotaxis sensor kinase CheA
MSRPSDERGAELRQIFFESTQELLESLNDSALKLENKQGDSETVHGIRRIVHTLKGDSAACGFRALTNAAHELEDALADENAFSHTELADIAFRAADIFGTMVNAYRRGQQPSPKQILRKSKGKPGSRRKLSPGKGVLEAVAVTWSEYERLQAGNAARQGKRLYHVTIQIDPACAMPIAARQLVLNSLAPLGEVLALRPENPSPKGDRSLDMLFASGRMVGELESKVRIPTVVGKASFRAFEIAGKSLPEAVEQNTAGAPPEETPASHTATSADHVIRVDAARVDNVLNLVGELIIAKSMLQQAYAELVPQLPKEAPRGRFSDAISFHARVLSDLQRSVMKIRMVPVDQLLRRFPRMVRDVARECGKEVELVIQGADTDLDKSLLDAIAEPLTHIVRNAVSHGFEHAAERVKAGKAARGRLQLSAYHHGNQVIIEVSDDGQGIDPHRVKAKAVEKGLIDSAESTRLSERETLDLVFKPGLSTAEQITEISGRGVGLDVVKAVLEKLKGSVEIDTALGKGTTFRLKLPLTLAIIKALLFRVGGRLYAIPLNAVAEIARSHERDIHLIQNTEVLQLRNGVLPLARLGRRPAVPTGDEKLFVLTIEIGERKLGLLVDELAGEEELVIKALDDETVSSDLVSGASILGDGRVVLIVNLPAIVDRASTAGPATSGARSGLLLTERDRADAVAAGEVQ